MTLLIDNLRKRGIAIVDWSCMCKSNGETLDYLFLLYDIAREHGLLCSVCLGLNGSCQEWQLNYFIAGKHNSAMRLKLLDLNICWAVAIAFLL
jgi:hypothetical protein